MKHELKTDKEVYEAVVDGQKTYEIRFDDRGYAVDDVLLLRETAFSGEQMKAGSPLVYTGASIGVKVTHVLRGPIYGLMDGWVIMSFRF